MPLSDVHHQLAAQRILQRGLAASRVPHGMLFAGPRGVGKGTLAERFAAVLLCESPQQIPVIAPMPGLKEWRDACGRCEACRLLAAGNHPDFHLIYRTLNRYHPDKNIQKRKALELGIDVVRHFLLDRVGLRPSMGRAKVFIVEEAEKLNVYSQNALLKTLEEPPEQTYIILLAGAADALLPTTRSRCQLIRFGTLPLDFVEQRLRAALPPDQGDPRLLAELSGGSLGQALRFAEWGLVRHVDVLLTAMQSAVADPLAAGKTIQDLAKDVAGTLKDAESDENDDQTAATRDAQMTVLSLASTLLRDVQRCVVGATPTALGREPRIPALARGVSSKSIRSGIQAIAEAESQLARNANQGLVFDTLGIRLGRALA